MEVTEHERPREHALRARQASRRIGDRALLDDVSIDVAHGRIVALAGPNGAGKTSLLRAVAGRLRLDHGDVAIDGRPAAEGRRLGRLGFVPQDIALYPHLTVRENLSVLARLSGVAAADTANRVEEALEWAGLDARASSIVRTLSGGMRRRVNLLAGTLHRPALLLLDEPTVGVDAESVARLHELLRALRARGTGLLLCTHDLDEAAALCDDIVVMARGRVVEGGPIASLIARAFADGRELAIAIAVPGPGTAQETLAAAGFRRTGLRTWVRPATDSLAELGAAEQQLRAAGVRLEGAELREPTLRGAVAWLADLEARQ